MTHVSERATTTHDAVATKAATTTSDPCCAPTCCDPSGADGQAATPETQAPETQAPETQAPETQAPETHAKVQAAYAAVARADGGCCGGTSSTALGYGEADLAAVPEGADLGLGCGNPTALASLQPGETVVDLGSGAGIDAFIAAERVGESGRVIGVDMTPEMLARARAYASEASLGHRVEFREGKIEALPIVSDSVDVILSNCVVNLSPDKPAVFREAFRVLKPGGRLAISDILLSEPLPEALRDDAKLYTACLAGALVADDYLGALAAAGFADVHWTRTPAASIIAGACASGDPVATEAVGKLAGGAEGLAAVADTVFSYTIEARKP